MEQPNIEIENVETNVENENETIIKKEKRGRKPKYANQEERHQAAILHQRDYRRRKKQQFEEMANRIKELTELVEQNQTNK